MANLNRTGPVVAGPGTLVAPEPDTAITILSQIRIEQAPFIGCDAESILTPIYGIGPPPDGTTSFFYVNSDAAKLYFRNRIDPIQYTILNP